MLRSSGPVFCAGADLNWMARIAINTNAEALRLQNMLRMIDECPKLTIAAVDGAAFAGRIGLVSVCDVVIEVVPVV